MYMYVCMCVCIKITDSRRVMKLAFWSINDGKSKVNPSRDTDSK